MNLSDLLEIVEVSTDPIVLENHGKDWSINYKADPIAVAFPKKETEVVQIVKWARENKCPIVPSGGRTGLSSAATATRGELVVSFDKMNEILELNPWDQSLRVQPGAITETVQKYAQEKGYFFPIDFAAKGSSQIGGNVATNAGGVRVLRYGTIRDWVAGLTVITGTGQRLKLNKGLVKNATGYDLKDLIIGSEGTLGLITEVELKLTHPPATTTVILLGLSHLENSLEVLRHFRKSLTLSACEFFSSQALDKVIEVHNFSPPFSEKFPYYQLLEIEHLDEDISSLLFPVFEHCFEQNWVNDGVISQSPQQAQALWNLREFISESLSAYKPYKNDISVRVSEVARFTHDLQSLFSKHYSEFEVILFGHIGDGNLHVNILKPDGLSLDAFLDKCHKSDTLLFELIKKYEGAVSAEHGVGLVKKNYLSFSRSDHEVDLMRKIKLAFDPDSILNPGKIFNLNLDKA